MKKDILNINDLNTTASILQYNLSDLKVFLESLFQNQDKIDPGILKSYKSQIKINLKNNPYPKLQTKILEKFLDKLKTKDNNMIESKLKTWLEKNDYDINDLNKRGKYGNSALMKAVREKEYEIAKAIISKGVELEIKNIDGNTALWNACFGGDIRCVELLIKNGINLDNENDNKVTPLMYCASSGQEDMTKILLEYGANKDIINLDGFKAIDLASTPKIVRLLR